MACTEAPTISFSIESMVRGYNVYKGVWTATIGEELDCLMKKIMVMVMIPLQWL